MTDRPFVPAAAAASCLSPPGLARLRLSTEERDTLADQGFVASEYRDGQGPYFKLRFRHHGRQAVRYLGTAPEFAEHVRRELAALQLPQRLQRALAQAAQEARQLLRVVKGNVAPAAERVGYRFHGHTLRKTRTPRSLRSHR